jgi:hypothetical protein
VVAVSSLTGGVLLGGTDVGTGTMVGEGDGVEAGEQLQRLKETAVAKAMASSRDRRRGPAGSR